jgi:hypothetical protein
MVGFPASWIAKGYPGKDPYPQTVPILRRVRDYTAKLQIAFIYSEFFARDFGVLNQAILLHNPVTQSPSPRGMLA